MRRKGEKYSGCRKCGWLAKHPQCPQCLAQAHWMGHLQNRGTDEEVIEPNAPARRVEDRLTLAYTVPFMVSDGQIPREKARGILDRILLDDVKLDRERVLRFDYGKHPYKVKIVDADLTGEAIPYIKFRRAGWECSNHRGAFPPDVPVAALKRDCGECASCGGVNRVAVERMVALEQDGPLSVANAVTMCAWCQEERGATEYWAYLRERGVPMDAFVISWDTGFVGSYIHGSRAFL